MSAIAVAPRDSNLVVAGTHKGHVVIVTPRARRNRGDGLGLDTVRAAGGSRLWHSIRKAPTTIYATYGNFGGAHVFRSADGGATWQSLDGAGETALPDIPVHSIVVDPDDRSRLYLGTDVGVFVSVDGGQRWLVEETGFGPVVTEWLSLIRDTSGTEAPLCVHSWARSLAR